MPHKNVTERMKFQAEVFLTLRETREKIPTFIRESIHHFYMMSHFRKEYLDFAYVTFLSQNQETAYIFTPDQKTKEFAAYSTLPRFNENFPEDEIRIILGKTNIRNERKKLVLPEILFPLPHNYDQKQNPFWNKTTGKTRCLICLTEFDTVRSSQLYCKECRKAKKDFLRTRMNDQSVKKWFKEADLRKPKFCKNLCGNPLNINPQTRPGRLPEFCSVKCRVAFHRKNKKI